NGILVKAQPEGTPRENRKTKFPYQETIVQTLQLGLDPDGEPPDAAARIVRMFLESCLAVRYVRVAPDTPGSVQLTTTGIDAEFLLSHLFGVPTRVPGFDNLFGGGGVLLVEREPTPGAEQFPARTMVIKGRFGTGKTL